MDFFIPDHAWVTTRGLSPDIIQDKILGSYMRKTTIKISADEMQCPLYYPDLFSFLNVDIFVMCKRKWPSSKFSQKSLNAFLAKVGEPPKYDMPAWRQFDIYEEMLEMYKEKKSPGEIRKYFLAAYDKLDAATVTRLCSISPDLARLTEDITNVNVYCVFDTISALDLWDKAGIGTEIQIAGEQYACTPVEAVYLAKGGLVMEHAVYSGFTMGYLDCDEKNPKFFIHRSAA
jgi:hypothetical protein